MNLWVLLGDIIILLAGAFLLGGLCSRFGQSPLVGYLLAGMLLGGSGSLGVIQSNDEIEAIAELGVALLLFSLGLEFSVLRLKKLGVRPLAGGAIQIVLTIALGAGAAMLFGLATRESIAVGTMIALSSTAVVLRILMERSEMDMPHGRNSLAVLLTQDMAVVPLALLMTLLGGTGDASAVTMQVGKLLLVTSGLVGGMFLLTKAAVVTLGKLTLHRNRELTMIFALGTGLGAAWISHQAGISPALGAFVAGMMLGGSPFAVQIRADVSTFRVVFLTLFFGSAGMVADPWWIVSHWHVVALVTILLTLGKLVIIWTIFRALGHTLRVAMATGLCLAQIGEFAFVLGAVGRGVGVVSTETHALIVSVTIVSFFLSALIVPRAPRIANWVASRFYKEDLSLAASSESSAPPDVVVIGFGPTAQIATVPLIEAGKEITVIDLNQEGVAQALACGFRGIIGDATQTEVLEHAQVPEAKVVLITIPNHQSALMILEQVRFLAPHVQVVVRSRYQMNTDDLISAGGHDVVGDEEQVGQALSISISKWLNSES
ncbi:MAG: cation:proton antiporter [Verrucomicrobiae bacterium]|nr:cation:proton antiporter [Verrucomicrobiae bacterium]